MDNLLKSLLSALTYLRDAFITALQQESWSGGPRVILVTNNITLQPGDWPAVSSRFLMLLAS
jgi:hypothetical protein